MKTISLPAGPFFLSPQGRYLPILTDLVIQYAAFQQRVEIEEQLFALRLKRKCFVAIAEQAPAALVQTPAPRRASLKIFPGGSVDGFNTQPESPSAPPLKRPSLTISNETVIRFDPPASFSDPQPHYPRGRYNP